MEKKSQYQQKEVLLNPHYLFFRHGFTYRHQLISLVSLIALFQFLLHLGAMNQYGFHQDELLYISLSKRLAWGYNETPPFIAIIGKISSAVFGDSLMAYRLIPALCAGAIVHVTGMLTIRLGGGFFAITIACLSVALSSAFLATGALFIPQVFDEFFWLLSAYLLVRYIEHPKDKYLYLLGVVIGVGLLVKYTLIIYIIGLIIGLLIYPKSRKLLNHKGLLKIAIIPIFIFLPHLLWQFQNGFPALHHYQELGQTQLIYLTRTDFIIQQLLVNGTGTIIWLAGLYYCLTNNTFRPYRFIAVASLFVMLILLLLNGKPYYGFGIFPPLFALGAIGLETIRKQKSSFRMSLIAVLIIPNLLLAVIVLPYLPIEKAAKVFQWTYDNLDLHFPLKWEDQQIHSVNQNYADMIGWEELAKKTSKIYCAMPKEAQKDALIFADNYGEAAAIDYYRSIYPMPPVVSLSSSFALWAPQQIKPGNIIYISLKPLPAILYAGTQKFGEIENPYSRVKGMDIYLLTNTKHFNSWYQQGKNKQEQIKKYRFAINGKVHAAIRSLE